PPESIIEPSADDSTLSTLRELDRIARRERRLEHALRRSSVSEAEARELREELKQLKLTAESLRHRREVELAD
ncbi:MAG: hypothetical protein WCA77_09980, partial [Thermoplasmata archaeon]